MKTYRIANTDLDVSRIAFGTWHLGGTWDDSPLTDEITSNAERLLRVAKEGGINFIDLADIYVRGKSDQVVGRVLVANAGLRDGLILQAKCGIQLSGQPNSDDPARYNFDAQHIVASLEGTLRSLGTDRVELLLLHRPDPLVEPNEVACAFDQLHADGKVRFFGVSNHSAMQIELLRKHVRQPLVVNQVQLSVLHHQLITDGFLANSAAAEYWGAQGTLDYCRLHDITLQAWSPLARGQLFNPPADAAQNVIDVAAELVRIAEVYSTTPECIAIAWLLRHPAGIQPILGTMNPARLSATVAADHVDLSRSEWFRLLAAARGAGVP